MKRTGELTKDCGAAMLFYLALVGRSDLNLLGPVRTFDNKKSSVPCN